MFSITRSTHSTLQAIAAIVALALVAWSLGLHMTKSADAANVTFLSDTISDSDVGVVANHTIQFIPPSGVADGETITLTFDTAGSNFTLTGIGDEDIDILEDGVNVPLAGWSSGLASDTITITFGGDAIAAGATTTILIGLHATNEGVPDTQITNPGIAGSYEIDIAGTMADSGHTRVVILDDVLVTATVDTVFDFTVSGLPDGIPVNGSPTTTSTSTTDTTLPFETLTANVSKTLAQQLNVTTNAIHGFIVTVEQSGNILSSTGADIDGFVDGSYTDTPQAWANPTNTLADENTWGHWALTTEDTDLEGAGTDFTSDQWVAASTTPRVVMAYDDPADGVTAGIGSTTVGYQIGITPLQEAGDDYNTTLTYIATPTF